MYMHLLPYVQTVPLPHEEHALEFLGAYIPAGRKGGGRRGEEGGGREEQRME